MKISDIIKSDKLTLSFEVFPPKTDAAYESVAGAIDKIADLKPSFMSVTYGAGGGTSEYTVSIAENGANPEEGEKNLFLLEEIMNEMRKDLGLKKVKKGNLLAFFINDIKKAMKNAKK